MSGVLHSYDDFVRSKLAIDRHKMKRRFLGVELKDTYFAHARRNLEEASRAATQGELFGGVA